MELPQTAMRESRVQTPADPESSAAPIHPMRLPNERHENAVPREQASDPHPHTIVVRAITPTIPFFVKPLRDANDVQPRLAQPLSSATPDRGQETDTAQSSLRKPALHDAQDAASRPSQHDARLQQPTDHLASPRERAAFNRSAREISEATTRLDRMLGRLRALSSPAESARDHVAHASAPPVVRVSIGRIEVRAAPAPYVAPPPVREERKPSGPTLAEYLSKRPRVSP
jgi:hypothetical protein